MAEYLSLGRDDVNTATWLRDAARRNDVPTIKQLTNDPRYFPYRYGQALWAYVGGRWGDQAVVDVYRQSLAYGFEDAIRRVLDVSTDQLSKDWGAAIKGAYLPLMAGRSAPDSTAHLLIGQKNEARRRLQPRAGAEPRRPHDRVLLVARAVRHRPLRRGRRDGARDLAARVDQPRAALRRAQLHRVGRRVEPRRQAARLRRVPRGRPGDRDLRPAVAPQRSKRLRTPDLGAALDPAWSPDGRTIAFSGSKGGISDLYLYDLQSDRVEQLTNGREAELQPAWSPDGRTLAFVTDRGPGTDFTQLTFAPTRLATMDVASRAIRVLPGFVGARHINPQ